MREIATAAFFAGLLACTGEVDVVARRQLDVDGGKPGLPETGLPSSTLPDAGFAFEVPDCADDARHLLLLDKSGALARVRADDLTIESLGTPDCLAGGVRAAAVDRTGSIWASDRDGRLWWVAANSTVCNAIALDYRVDVMAFVFQAEAGRELLYVVDGDALYQVDPTSLESFFVATLVTRFLTGTSSGELLTLTDVDPRTLIVDAIDPDSATVIQSWKSARPRTTQLWGAAAWAGDIALLFDQELVRYRRDTGDAELLLALPPHDGFYVALASSICSLP